MDINITTPALLFPAISLLLLAYTNRFLALAALIRSLHDRYEANPDDILVAQIGNLAYRIKLIQGMQGAGVSSLLLCVVCMFLLFNGNLQAGEIVFGISLILMMISLFLSIMEIWVSAGALNLQLQTLDRKRHGG